MRVLMAYLPSLPCPHPQEDGQSRGQGGGRGARCTTWRDPGKQARTRFPSGRTEASGVCWVRGEAGAEARCQAAPAQGQAQGLAHHQRLHWSEAGLADQRGRGGDKEWLLTTGY